MAETVPGFRCACRCDAGRSDARVEGSRVLFPRPKSPPYGANGARQPRRRAARGPGRAQDAARDRRIHGGRGREHRLRQAGGGRGRQRPARPRPPARPPPPHPRPAPPRGGPAARSRPPRRPQRSHDGAGRDHLHPTRPPLRRMPRHGLLRCARGRHREPPPHPPPTPPGTASRLRDRRRPRPGGPGPAGEAARDRPPCGHVGIPVGRAVLNPRRRSCFCRHRFGPATPCHPGPPWPASRLPHPPSATPSHTSARPTTPSSSGVARTGVRGPPSPPPPGYTLPASTSGHCRSHSRRSGRCLAVRALTAWIAGNRPRASG